MWWHTYSNIIHSYLFVESFFLPALADKGYLGRKSMINYLAYLQYWKTQPYVKFIKYALPFLSLKLFSKIPSLSWSARPSSRPRIPWTLRWSKFHCWKWQFDQTLLGREAQTSVLQWQEPAWCSALTAFLNSICFNRLSSSSSFLS